MHMISTKFVEFYLSPVKIWGYQWRQKQIKSSWRARFIRNLASNKKRGGGYGYGYILYVLLHLKKSGYPPPRVPMPMDSMPLEIIRYPNI